MKDRSNIRYVIYARKSTEGEDRQIESIDNQVEVLEKLAKSKKLNVIQESLCDSKSAKTPYQRPAFTAMLALIERGEANGIICWQLNRLSRNPAESGILQQMLQDEKIQSIQTSDREYLPDDNAVVFSVEAGISNQFIRDLRKNVKRGIEHKLRHGGISGVAMPGYLNKQKGDEKWIEPDPIRYPLVRKLWDLFLTGNYSVPQLMQMMNEDWGYRTPRRKNSGGNPISRTGVYNILRNPRYAGRIPNPYDEDGEPFKGEYKHMITVEEYDRAQELLGERGCPRLTPRRDLEYMRLLKCGECGCMVTGEIKIRKLINGSANEHIYYHCTHKKPCGQRSSIKEGDLKKQLDELLDKYELTPKLYEWGVAALNEFSKEEVGERDSVQTMQNEAIATVQKKLDNLLDLAEYGSISPEQYKQRSDALKAELKRLQKEQAKTAERTRNWYEVIGETMETLTNANEKFAKGGLNEKSEVLLAIGQNAVLINEKVSITPNEWLLPVRDNASTLRAELEKVRTMPKQIQKASEEAILQTWYPGRDSNPQPYG